MDPESKVEELYFGSVEPKPRSIEQQRVENDQMNIDHALMWKELVAGNLG